MKKILVVDDDQSILDALNIILHDEGYEVKFLSEGTHIQQHIRTFAPDLILLDIWMSGKDGIQIAQELKKDPRTRTIPCIIISALSDGEKVAKKQGVDFLMKPFTISDLLGKIKKYIGI